MGRRKVKDIYWQKNIKMLKLVIKLNERGWNFMNKYEFEIRDGNKIVASGVIYTSETELQNSLDLIASNKQVKKPKIKVRRKNKE